MLQINLMVEDVEYCLKDFGRKVKRTVKAE
jgi:hypothetical protein